MEIVTENQNVTYFVYASVGVNLVPDFFINHHNHPTSSVVLKGRFFDAHALLLSLSVRMFGEDDLQAV